MEMNGKRTLSSALPYLLRPEYMGFMSFCACSRLFLTGSWTLAMVKGAVWGSARRCSASVGGECDKA